MASLLKLIQSSVRSIRTAPLLSAALCLLALGAFVTRADWPDHNTNVTKWAEFPDRYTGFDVLAGQPPPGPTGLSPFVILADDFKCTRTGPITDIHLWTSWLGLGAATASPPPIPITLAFWSDVPAVTNADGNVIPSHPGNMLWSQTFIPGQYIIRPWSSAQEQFWNPDPFPQGEILGPDYLIWQYNFYPDPAKLFTQTGTLKDPIIYWLSMTSGNPSQPDTSNRFFGWKTSTNQLGDNAVFGHLDATGNPLGDWNELLSPTTPTRSLDLSFVLTTPDEQPPPPPPPLLTNKWVQYPTLLRGYDINASAPFLAADDFKCTNAGPVTNIQVWASWRDDAAPDPNTRFILSIWSDVPAGTTGGFSHPGRVLWSEPFVPGQYFFKEAGVGDEMFYDPATGQLTAETRIWLYNFTPKSPWCQKGSVNSPVTYWLSVQAITAAGTPSQFGWKTSTNHWNDDAVFGRLTSTGTYAWKELVDPLTTAALVSLDLAFRIDSGPPGPDCEPTVHRKWFQPPNTSDTGLDVLATAPEVLGDDFLCRAEGPISGITIWGSWLNDKVDSNAVFQVSLWTDVPADPAGPNYSHPGSLLCRSTFYPPKTVGTSLERYNYSLFQDGVHERFYNPDIPGPGGFMGNDTQIWRYDFYPFQFPNSCWHQFGSPLTGAGKVYWIVVTYLPSAGTEGNLFGWKTSVTHRMDDAVYGHLDPNNTPLGDWKDLHDPVTGQSLDQAFALWQFPVTGINKDLVNHTQFPASGIQLVVAGYHIVTWHYDGAPPWPDFQVSQSGGNTVLQWSGQTVPPGGITHIGFEMGSSAKPVILSINWLVGGAAIQPPIPQANFHWLNSGLTLAVLNSIALAPISLTGGMVEYYAMPPGLDQMIRDGQREPLERMQLAIPREPIMEGGVLLLNVPPGPPNANYAMFMLNLADSAGSPTTTDFLLLPLDSALQPTIDSVALGDAGLNLNWSSVPGRTYRLQYRPDFEPRSSWSDSGMGDINAEGPDTSLTVPIMGTQGFYRVYLVPE
jgi:hypothetical protein